LKGDEERKGKKGGKNARRRGRGTRQFAKAEKREQSGRKRDEEDAETPCCSVVGLAVHLPPGHKGSKGQKNRHGGEGRSESGVVNKLKAWKHKNKKQMALPIKAEGIGITGRRRGKVEEEEGVTAGK